MWNDLRWIENWKWIFWTVDFSKYPLIGKQRFDTYQYHSKTKKNIWLDISVITWIGKIANADREEWNRQISVCVHW